MIIVGCGKAKCREARPARDLYIGTLFRASRCYAELTGERWLILSAAHGVVSPETVLGPYDQRMCLGASAAMRWARLAADAIESRLEERRERVEILAGKDYAGPLAKELRERGARVELPLDRLSLGYRLRRLGEMADEALERKRVARGLQTERALRSEKEGIA